MKYCFPDGTGGKEPACQCRRHKTLGFNPWVRKFPRVRNGNPLQYSCLVNPTHREAWWATVLRVQRVRHNATEHTRIQPLRKGGEKKKSGKILSFVIIWMGALC